MPKESNVETIDIAVSGMVCEGCARSVRGALGALDGVSEVEVDVARGAVAVAVEDGKVSRTLLERAIEEAGFEVVR